jgi:hypothetical protein
MSDRGPDKRRHTFIHGQLRETGKGKICLWERQAFFEVRVLTLSTPMLIPIHFVCCSHLERQN